MKLNIQMFATNPDNFEYQPLPNTSTPLNPPGLNRIYKLAKALGLDQDTYDPTHTYAVGDLVVHDFQIWECNTANTTGTWDSTKWTLVPIIDYSNL